MNIPEDLLRDFLSDVSRASVSRNPVERTDTVVKIHTAIIRERLGIAWNGPREVELRAELRRVAGVV